MPGLSLRITVDGHRSFALRYRIGSRQRRLTLGSYDPEGFNLIQARELARDRLKLVDRGIDPAQAKPDLPARGTVREVAADYVERHVRKNVKRAHDVEMMLKRDIVAHWGDRPVASITRRDVRDLVDGVVEQSVAAGVKPPAREKPRDRTLTDAELRAVWGAFDRMGYPFGALGKLLILTAQRRGEVAGMRWSMVDLDGDAPTWRLESSDTKAGRRHVVPLSPQAVEILWQLPRFAGDDRVFPSGRAGSANAMSGFSKALRRAVDLSGVAGWTWHDLRRTSTTGMARLNVAPHVCERVLNHSAGRAMSQVAKVYNVHSYMPEVRRALELWAVEVERIVADEPAKVVALKR